MSESSSGRRLGAVKRSDSDPGSASSPAGSTVDPSARGDGPTPAANQGKNEPLGEQPETSAQSRTVSTTSADPQAPAKGGGSQGAADSGGAGSDSGRSRADSGGARSDDPNDIAAAGRASRAPGDQGEPPRAIETDDVVGAISAHPGSPPASHDAGVPTPGDSQGVAVPGVQSAAGTSEQTPESQSVKTTALAPPGKPDGEVDTRA